MSGRKKLKAVGLISGGLDSLLAARMLKEQGVEVVGLNFSTGFCKVDHRRAVRRRKDTDPKKLRNEALQAASQAEFPLEIVDVSREYLDVVTRPRHGYGKNANPCIDCRIFMLEKAKEHADRIGAEVVFTGEVLGQRPMSQHRKSLDLIERETGLEGRLLRPLSARSMAPTDAEIRGELDRRKLGRIAGRSRKGQMELVEEYGIDEFSQPGGGCCYLADENYARRFRDLMAHRSKDSIVRDDLVLLKVGRHFRISAAAKAVVGREESENAFLRRFAAGTDARGEAAEAAEAAEVNEKGEGGEPARAMSWTMEAPDGGSPLTMIDGEPDRRELDIAARITARYSDLKDRAEVRVRMTRGDETEWTTVAPAKEPEIGPMRL